MYCTTYTFWQPFSYRNGIFRLPHSDEEWKLIYGLSKGTSAVTLDPIMITSRVKKLPAKPWPVTVADAPMYLTTSETDQPISLDRRNESDAILEELNAAKGSRSQLLTKMMRQVAVSLQEISLKFSSSTYLGSMWVVHIQDGTQLTTLSRNIYMFFCLISTRWNRGITIVKKLLYDWSNPLTQFAMRPITTII